MSADDGIRNLYLDFGGPEGELVSMFLKNMFILIGILFLIIFYLLLLKIIDLPSNILFGAKKILLQVSKVHGFGFGILFCVFPTLGNHCLFKVLFEYQQEKLDNLVKKQENFNK